MKPTDVAMAPVNMLTFLLGVGAIVVAIVYGSCGPTAATITTPPSATEPQPAEVDVPLQDHVDQRIDDLRGHVDQRFEDLRGTVNERFDDLRDLIVESRE